MRYKVWGLPVAWELRKAEREPQLPSLTAEQYQILRGLISNELWHVANYIRVADNLELRERQCNLKAVLSELEATKRTQKEG